jgi:hypothetical protein
MKIKSFIEIKMIVWFLSLSFLPVAAIIRTKSGWLMYAIMEVLIAGFVVWNIWRNRGKALLYDSDTDVINISGLKEGSYDPDSIRIGDIRAATEEGRKVRIALKNGKEIHLRNIGSAKRRMIIEDIENRIESVKIGA